MEISSFLGLIFLQFYLKPTFSLKKTTASKTTKRYVMLLYQLYKKI